MARVRLGRGRKRATTGAWRSDSLRAACWQSYDATYAGTCALKAYSNAEPSQTVRILLSMLRIKDNILDVMHSQ